MGGEWALGVALVNEIWGGKNRAWIAGMIGAASNIGFLLTGLISWQLNASLEVVTGWINAMGLSPETTDYLLHNRAWRFIAVSSALPALINFFILVFVPESHKWGGGEESRQHLSLGHDGLDRCAGRLRGSPGNHLCLEPDPRCMDQQSGRRRNHADWSGSRLVGVPASCAPVHDTFMCCRRRAGAGSCGHHENLLIGAGLAAVALLGTWGSAQQAAKWASDLAPKGSSLPVLDYVVISTALGAILVTLITPLVADKLGRRVTYTLLCVAALASALGFFQFNKPFTGDSTPVSLIATAFLLGGITASFYGFFPLYFPELFPRACAPPGRAFALTLDV